MLPQATIPAAMKPVLNDVLTLARRMSRQYAQDISSAQKKTNFDPVMTGLAQTDFPEKVLARGKMPFAFWEIKDDAAFEFFLTELSDQLECCDLEDDDFSDLPLGYGVCRHVLAFEFSCASEGWFALQNTDEDEFALLLEFYEKIGLADEARALVAANTAWALAGPSDVERNAAASRAYSSVSGQYKDDDERWAYLLHSLRAPSCWLG